MQLEDQRVDWLLHTPQGTFLFNYMTFNLLFINLYLHILLFVFHSWIISYFHRIHGYDPDPLYNDDIRGVHGLGQPTKSGQIHQKNPKKVGWVGQLGGYGFQNYKG